MLRRSALCPPENPDAHLQRRDGALVSTDRNKWKLELVLQVVVPAHGPLTGVIGIDDNIHQDPLFALRIGLRYHQAIPLVTDAAVFRVYVDQVLVPTLGPDDVVVMDNLGAHKVKGIIACLPG